ncbi:sensor histidine kinase [Azohydromonas lata]|uniref:histidine kinase n=1 Tax=Azohydromonas lata TaxID=45677 RepID=A0ABU5IP29_9BURK|nr:sensor histidine kinase [Azohydromonas lata]MDZ5460657.1 sensor histidine kinase [Azohydromonas lata]
MDLPAGSGASLRARLLRRLWWPLLAVLLLSAVYDYLQAAQRAQDNQDLLLGRMAAALASRLDLDEDDARNDDPAPHLRRTVETMQAGEGDDRLLFAVQGAEGRLLGGDAAVLALARPGAAAPSFDDAAIGGHAVRVATWPHQAADGRVLVVIAETVVRRQAQVRGVLLDTLWPNLLLMALAMLLVHGGVRGAMAPLEALSREVGACAAEDLRPLAHAGLPRELAPLVLALNGLMAHLRRSAASQQAFLSNAAHQLRTPLAGVQTQIELALQDAQPAQRERLGAVSAALGRMARTTHQMLALARAGSDAVQVQDFTPLDLRELLEAAASEWLDAALAAQVDLGFDAEPATVCGSAWMLHELLNNLIHNALRHSPPNTAVTVRCGQGRDGLCRLSVEDAGPGIPSAQRARVFDRFYRPTNAKPGGAGLGLAIVREVAWRHGGEVSLETAPGGQGLLVCVTLPAVPAQSPR